MSKTKRYQGKKAVKFVESVIKWAIWKNFSWKCWKMNYSHGPWAPSLLLAEVSSYSGDMRKHSYADDFDRGSILTYLTFKIITNSWCEDGMQNTCRFNNIWSPLDHCTLYTAQTWGLQPIQNPKGTLYGPVRPKSLNKLLHF